MPDDPAIELSSRLQADEKLLWSGRPLGGFRFQSADLLLVPFSLMWGGFAIFWEWSVVSHVGADRGPPLFFALWGIPFVLVGLYLIVGRFFVDARRRESTIYGLTNRRALIISGIFGRYERSAMLAATPEIGIKETAARRGTITFGTVPFAFLADSGWPGTASRLPPRFEEIEDARTVYNLVVETQRAARA